MVVRGQDAVEMPKNHSVAISGVVVAIEHHSGCGGVDRRATSRAEINAVVEFADTSDGMNPHTVGRRDRTADWATHRP